MFSTITFASSVIDLKKPCEIDPIRLHWGKDMPASIISRSYKLPPKADANLQKRERELIEGVFSNQENLITLHHGLRFPRNNQEIGGK